MVKAVVRISIDRRAAEQTRQALLQIVLCASGAGGPVTGDDGAADASALNGTPFRASIDAQRLYIGCPDTRDAEALAAFIGHYRANIGGILAVDVTGVSWVRASYTAERGQRATLIVGPYTSTSEARARALSWTFGDGSMLPSLGGYFPVVDVASDDSIEWYEDYRRHAADVLPVFDVYGDQDERTLTYRAAEVVEAWERRISAADGQ